MKNKHQLYERHYSPKELAQAWHFSPEFIRELFAREPGVLKIARPEKMNKRRYSTIRIPASVADRVYERLKKSG